MDRIRSSSPGRRFGTKLLIIGVVAVLGVVGLIVYVAGAWEKVEPGVIGVVRNGGPFTARTYQRTITVNDGVVHIGWASTVDEYPITDRYDNIEPGAFGEPPNAGDTADVDEYRTNTKDGVNVGVKAQFKYQLNTDEEVLKNFDQVYGQRTYADPADPSKRVKVSEGDDGMRVFIAQQVRPLEEEAMRGGIGDTVCSALDSSCALLNVASSDPAKAAAQAAALASAPSNSATYDTLNGDIGAAMTKAINAQLGGPYLINVTFVLRAIDLPPNVRDAINNVQVSAAAVAKANADAAAQVAAATGRAQAASQDAQAQINKQNGYNACHDCATQDNLKAAGEAQKNANSGWGDHPPQVYAPGNTNTQLQFPVGR